MSKIDVSKIDVARLDTSKIDMSKISSREDTNKAVRILRSWRGYAVGAIIRPPGSVRQILLEAMDKSGKPFAELVEAVQMPIAKPAEVEKKTSKKTSK